MAASIQPAIQVLDPFPKLVTSKKKIKNIKLHDSSMPRNTVGTGASVLVNQLSDRYNALTSCKHKVWFRQQAVAELVANRLHTALRQLLAGDKEPPLRTTAVYRHLAVYGRLPQQF